MCSLSRKTDSDVDVCPNIGLDLCGNEICERGASYISKALQNTNILVALWLSFNPIGDHGLQTIFRGLKKNKTLKNFSIAKCCMTDIGMTSLAETIRINKSIVNLDINHNDDITDKGLLCLVQVLSTNSTIKLLKLRIPDDKANAVWTNVNQSRGKLGLKLIQVNG